MRGVTDEPQIVPIVGRARFAGSDLARRQSRGIRGAIRSVIDNALEHLGYRICHGVGNDLLALDASGIVDEHVARPIGHLHDARGVAMHAACGKRSISACHLGGVGVIDAKGNRWRGAKVVAVKAKALGHRFHRFGSNATRRVGDEAHEARVRRNGGHVRDGEIAVVLLAVVVDLRTVNLNRTVAVHIRRLRVDALFDGIGNRKRLECRARLRARFARGDVVLVGIVIFAADHGFDKARIGIDEREREFLIAGRKTPGIVLLLHCGFSVALHFRIDGGHNLQTALEDLLMIVRLKNLVAHIAGEVLIEVHAIRAGFLLNVEVQVLGLRRVIFLLGDNAIGKHARKHHIATIERVVGVDDRVVHRGRIRNADERRGLSNSEVTRIHRVIMLRRSLDAVAVVTVVDGVQIHHQNLVFGVNLFHLFGERHLANLALDGNLVHLGRQDGVAHILLRDGGSALLAASEIHEHRADNTLQVDAAMVVETLVFRRDRSLEHVGAHLIDCDGLAFLHVQLGQHGSAVVGIDGRLFRQVESSRILHTGQIGAPVIYQGHNSLIAAVADQPDAGQNNDDGPEACVCAFFALFSPWFHTVQRYPKAILFAKFYTKTIGLFT